MRISDWSSDVCSSDLVAIVGLVACHFGTCVDLAFTGTAVFAFLLFLAFFGLALVLLAAVLGAFLQRLVAVDEVEVAERELRGIGEGGLIVEQIGRASCRERVCRTCRSRWSPYH